MEIPIGNVSDPKFFDEVLSVMHNYKRIIKNPKKKVYGLSFNALVLCGVSFVLMLLFKMLSVIDAAHASYYFYLTVIFILIFSWGLVYYIRVKNRISELENENSNNRLIIEDDFVELDSNGTKHRLESSDIEYVIINRYSICFLSSDENVLGVDVAYKGEVMDAIGDDWPVVDNSGLY